MDARVTCRRCRARLAERDVFDVGNQARPNMGHALFFHKDGGTIALCIARVKEQWQN